MDADGREIPLVEDDQGEGIKDFIEDTETEQVKGIRETSLDVFEAKLKDMAKDGELEHLEKGKTQNEMLQLILDKVSKLEEKIGNHALILGRWVVIKPPGEGPRTG